MAKLIEVIEISDDSLPIVSNPALFDKESAIQEEVTSYATDKVAGLLECYPMASRRHWTPKKTASMDEVWAYFEHEATSKRTTYRHHMAHKLDYPHKNCNSGHFIAGGGVTTLASSSSFNCKRQAHM